MEKGLLKSINIITTAATKMFIPITPKGFLNMADTELQRAKNGFLESFLA